MNWLKENLSKTLLVLVVACIGLTLLNLNATIAICLTFFGCTYILKEAVKKLADRK